MYIWSGIYQPNIMRQETRLEKTVNAGRVGGTEKGKVRERKDKGWEKTWERGENGERNRYKEWGEKKRGE